MAKHLIYMLSKVGYGRISDSKFRDCKDGIIESLRKDFPYVQPLKMQNSFRFELKMEGAPELFTEADPVLSLLSADKTWGIRIAPNFVIIHTKKYSGFADFRSRLLAVIDAVYEHFAITHISFVGMRYLNSFEYNPEFNFSDSFRRMEFLQPQLGTWDMAGSNLSSRYVVNTEAVNVNSGVMINAPRYLPDLMDLASELDDVSKVIAGPTAFLDIDSFFGTEELVSFNREFISHKIETLRNNANAVYQETIYSA